jgi:drug/metabolite transporter (DMT)-like permease
MTASPGTRRPRISPLGLTFLATASIGRLLVPVAGVLSAAAMLHEPLGLRELIALVVALGGVAVALRAH